MGVIESIDFPLYRKLASQAKEDLVGLVFNVHKQVFDLIEQLPESQKDMRLTLMADYFKEHPNMNMEELLGLSHLVDQFTKWVIKPNFPQFKFFYDQWMVLEEADCLMVQSILCSNNKKISDDMHFLARAYYWEASQDPSYKQNKGRHATLAFDHFWPIVYTKFATLTEKKSHLSIVKS